MTERLRLATRDDARPMLRIYEPIVRETAISFEETPPTEEEMAARVERTLLWTPWLVCDSGGELVGYAYAGRFRERAAYQWTVEVTVYVAAEHHGRGVGRRLYRALFDGLEAQGFRSAVAGIALPNPASVALHERLGFERIGVFPRVGFKLGRWHDVGWWRLALRDDAGTPEPPRPLPEVMESDAWKAALDQG